MVNCKKDDMNNSERVVALIFCSLSTLVSFILVIPYTYNKKTRNNYGNSVVLNLFLVNFFYSTSVLVLLIFSFYNDEMVEDGILC